MSQDINRFVTAAYSQQALNQARRRWPDGRTTAQRQAAFADRYGFPANLMKTTPELNDLFWQAQRGDEHDCPDCEGHPWTSERFKAELLATQWWKDNR